MEMSERDFLPSSPARRPHHIRGGREGREQSVNETLQTIFWVFQKGFTPGEICTSSPLKEPASRLEWVSCSESQLRLYCWGLRCDVGTFGIQSRRNPAWSLVIEGGGTWRFNSYNSLARSGTDHIDLVWVENYRDFPRISLC
eukprot:1183035-Prorocentrum_minimum.AAC.2